MVEAQVYKTMLSEFIKKQMIILGPNVALSTAKKIPSLKFADDGTVVDIEGDPFVMLKAVRSAYSSVSGEIAQMTFRKVLEKYPELKLTE